MAEQAQTTCVPCAASPRQRWIPQGSSSSVQQINHLLETEQSAKKQQREPVRATPRTDA